MKPAAIDWSRPWLAPYRPAPETIEAPVVEVLRRLGDPPCARFVPHECLPAGEAYEAFIFRTGTIPTRDNLHDFFNGLVWRAFPRTKQRLNVLQAGEIARRGVGATRGPLRDALTLFDENGAVLEAPPALWQALAAGDWRGLFVGQRALWAQARLRVFGHALLEQLAAAPRKPLTAHVLCLPDAHGPGALDDAALAARLDAGWLAQKPFRPLPVLGTPGWWAANEAPDFYDDPGVFRPRRPAAATA